MAESATAEAAPSTFGVPGIRQLRFADLAEALAKGRDDFLAKPSHMVFLSIIYPLVALVASRLTFGYQILPLLFPLCAGFALVGPIAAVGLYEISRRRERGETPSWYHALNVVRAPGIGALLAIAVMLAAIFLAWLGAAHLIYTATLGGPPASVGAFLGMLMTEPAGWTLVVAGNLVGLVFAAIVLTLTVVSVPMILHRNVGALTAIRTSVRAVRRNPVIMAAWGLTVAALLILGAIPGFVGLAITVPILGHATWHLYRRTVTA